MSDIVSIHVVVAHHDRNEFVDLGEVNHDTSPAKVFEGLLPRSWSCSDPETGSATCEHYCILLDGRDAADSVVDDMEITRETAEMLLAPLSFDEALVRGCETNDQMEAALTDLWHLS